MKIEIAATGIAGIVDKRCRQVRVSAGEHAGLWVNRQAVQGRPFYQAGRRFRDTGSIGKQLCGSNRNYSYFRQIAVLAEKALQALQIWRGPAWQITQLGGGRQSVQAYRQLSVEALAGTERDCLTADK